MTELDKNFNEVVNKALETGEKVITMECPCCHKLFYVTESEAAYQYTDPADQSALKLKQLGRKCPYCGFAGAYDGGLKSKYEQDVEQMKVEMEAEKMAEEAAEKRQASWAEINNTGLGWKR